TAKSDDLTLEGVKVNGGEALGKVKTFDFEGNSTKFEYLRDGEYSLKEIVAPDGFSTVSEFTFTVADGLVTKTSAVTDGVVTAVDGGTRVKVEDMPIIKLDKKALGGEPISEEAGKAKFVLTAEGEGSTLEGVKLNGGEALGKVSSAEFDGNNATFEYLKKGTYSLEETAAPDGFTTVTKFTFDIDEKGNVTNVSTVTDGKAYVDENGHLVVEDAKSTVTIDKKALGGEEIPAEAGSAKFVLTAEDKNGDLGGVTVATSTAAGETLKEGTKSYTFEGNSINFTGLKNGKYSLEETAAPSGFTTVTKFTFTVENGKVTSVDTVTDGDVKIKDDGKTVEVQDDKTNVLLDKKALGGEEIPASAGNATFVIAPEGEGNTLEGVEVITGTATSGKKLTAKDASYTFEGNNVRFIGLKKGTYSLEETAAPSGFTTVTKFT
ncbi:SpaA isopeptide-forming pilin-related protein, partial [Ruminococcus flavefaciens]|uniref:SpaA isopeptide-forming pilin-related protein n=1 Tax=Ruminococcus flavefaciens TaxID=1265 RepID=UPI000561015F